MDLSDWFKGFQKGISRLSPEQRSAFFSECAKNCVNNGVLPVYRKLYDNANGDIDVFLQGANDLPGVKCEIVKKKDISTILSSWNAPVAYARKTLSPRRCFASVPARA